MKTLLNCCLQSLLVVLIGSIATGDLRAQTSNINPNLPPIPPQDIIPPTPPTPPFPPVTPPKARPSTAETITVTKFIFTGNTAFTGEELTEEITTGLTNKPLSLTRLLEIASGVANLYATKGYSTSGAIISIPEQTQQQGRGIVEVRVIEGELEEITILSAKDSLSLNPNYIRSRLQLAASKPLNINRLQEALQLLQLDPLISKISATLSAGSRSGQSVLEVAVTEAPSFNVRVVADNYRSPSIGSFDRGSIVSEANLLGLGDGLSLSYFNTDGSDRLDTSYTIPINPHNGTLSFTYNYQANDVIEPPFDRLDIESESNYYELNLRQPIVQNIDRETQTFDEVALGLSGSWRDSQSSLSNIPFPLSPGATEDGETRIFALRFAQEWTRRNAQSVFALRSEFSVGLDAFDATTNEQIEGVERIPDSRFFAWRGQAQWVRLLASDTLLLLRGNLQLADDALLPSEQFGIGGFYTVRGYRQDVLLTDNGLSASAELRLPLLSVPEEKRLLQIIPFVDYGIGWNNFDVPNPDPQNLASVGMGLLWQEDDFNVRLDWGIPLVDIDSRDRTLQEQGLYLSMQWSP